MRTVTIETGICCPHCDVDGEYEVESTICIENTCASWRVVDGENELTCDECGGKFKATAHLDVKVDKI